MRQLTSPLILHLSRGFYPLARTRPNRAGTRYQLQLSTPHGGISQFLLTSHTCVPYGKLATGSVWSEMPASGPWRSFGRSSRATAAAATSKIPTSRSVPATRYRPRSNSISMLQRPRRSQPLGPSRQHGIGHARTRYQFRRSRRRKPAIFRPLSMISSVAWPMMVVASFIDRPGTGAATPAENSEFCKLTRLRTIFRQCPGTFRVWPSMGGSVLSSFQDVPSSAAVNNSAMTANCRARSAAASALSRLSTSSSSCSSCSSNSSCPLM